jgi:hypothetical protein
VRSSLDSAGCPKDPVEPASDPASDPASLSSGDVRLRIPDPSYVTISYIKSNFPLKLLDFYESQRGITQYLSWNNEVNDDENED